MSSVATRRWEEELLHRVRWATGGQLFWRDRLDEPGRGVHLAVMVEPYLSMLMRGRKTVESRFSATRRPPWGCVHRGDLLLLKRSAGPVVGICEVAGVHSYRLDAASLREIRERYARRLGVEGDEFWGACAELRYATLLEVEGCLATDPLPCRKRDQRGWVVLRPGSGGRDAHRVRGEAGRC